MGTETLKRLSAVILLCTIGVASSPSFAQSSGSSGGTVGKQDKSTSGGDEPAATRRHGPATPKRSANTSDRCSSVAGSYTYPAETVTVFKSDKTATNSFGLEGTWSCARGTITVHWNTGFVDRLVPSGRLNFSATNNHGWAWVAQRL